MTDYKALAERLDATDEEWRPVPGYEAYYEVSSVGRVRSLRSGRLLTDRCLVWNGYVKTSLWANGIRRQRTVHQLVAEAFLQRQDGQNEVNHKNGIKTDNRVENLEWCSKAYNVRHRFYGLCKGINRVRATPVSGGASVEFASVSLAARNGFDSAHIYRCLRHPHKVHKGYRWQSIPPEPDVAATNGDTQ